MNHSNNRNAQEKEREGMAKKKKQELLFALIDSELSKNEKDLDSEVLESFLEAYDVEQPLLSQAQMEQSLAKIKNNVRKSLQEKSKAKASPYKAWIALAASLLIVFYTVLLPQRSVEWRQEREEEVLVLEGVESKDEKRAFASINFEMEESEEDYVIHSWEEANRLLGFTLSKPKWIPSELQLEEIVVSPLENHIFIYVYYEIASGFKRENLSERNITLQYHYFDRLEGRALFEQNEKGRILHLENGKEIYVSQNIETVWGLVVESNVMLSGFLNGYDEDTLLRIFNSIEEW